LKDSKTDKKYILSKIIPSLALRLYSRLANRLNILLTKWL